MTPSITIGVHSIVVPLPASPVLYVQATWSFATLSRLIWSRGE